MRNNYHVAICYGHVAIFMVMLQFFYRVNKFERKLFMCKELQREMLLH